MESVLARSHTAWGRSIALLAIIAIATVVFSSPKGAEAGTCHSLAQNITKLKNASCKGAKHLVNSAYRQGVNIPECKGDTVIRFRGWKFKAIGSRDITVRVTKDTKRFILSGGGTC